MAEKHKINLSKDSILVLLQEVYNELSEQRNLGVMMQTKIISFMKTPEDTSLMIPVFEKQQKVVNDIIEKKIALAKLQSTLWTKEKGNKGEGDIGFNIGDIDENILAKFMNKDSDQTSDTETYKIK